MLLALLAACAPLGTGDGAPDGDAYVGAPASFAAPPDTGPDDTGADDTGGVEALRTDCVEADLVYTAETWLPPEEPVEGMGPAESAYIGGVLTNPCANDVTLATPSACLVASLVLTDPAGVATEYEIICDRGETPITVPGGQAITELADAGALAAGTWGLEIRFTAGVTETTSFDVAP